MSRAKTSAKSTGFKMDFESGSRLVRFRFQKPATCCNGSSRKFAKRMQLLRGRTRLRGCSESAVAACRNTVFKRRLTWDTPRYRSFARTPSRLTCRGPCGRSDAWHLETQARGVRFAVAANMRANDITCAVIVSAYPSTEVVLRFEASASLRQGWTARLRAQSTFQLLKAVSQEVKGRTFAVIAGLGSTVGPDGGIGRLLRSHCRRGSFQLNNAKMQIKETDLAVHFLSTCMHHCEPRANERSARREAAKQYRKTWNREKPRKKGRNTPLKCDDSRDAVRADVCVPPFSRDL